MKYNLGKNAFFEANISVGNLDINTEILLDIMLNQASVTVSGSEGTIVCLDVDLGMLISCSEMRYYFTSVSTSGTVASGIQMFYKEELADSYSSFDVSIGSGYYIGTISSGVLSPKYIRLLHTLNGTSVYGDINGFEVINNDDVVDFGTDGAKTDDTFTAITDEVTIRTIPIYNNGNRTSTAYVTIEPQDTYVDDMLYISNYEDGPWVGVRDSAYTISDSSSWTNGNHYGTQIQNDRLILSGENTSGYYKTRIFDYEFAKYSYIDLDVSEIYTYPIVSVDSSDTTQTIEIRSSDNKPINYRVYRYTYTYRSDNSINSWRLYDYWLDDNTMEFNLGNFAAATGYYQANVSHKFLHTVVSPNRVTYVLDAYFYRDLGEYVRLWQVDDGYSVNDHSNDYYNLWSINYTSASWHGGNTQVYNVYTDDDNGIWIYLYIQVAGTSGDMTSAGYYLFHFSYGLIKDFVLFNTSDFIYDMDVVNDNNVQKLWYIDKTTGDLIKISKQGVIETSTSISTVVGGTATGVTTTTDGGCWIIAAPNIYKFDSSGVLESTLSDVASDDSSAKYIARDKGEDAIWLLEIGRLKRIKTDGRIDFTYTQSTLVSIMDSSHSGIWLKNSGTNYYDFFDRESRSILRSYGSSTIDNRPGIIDYSYDDEVWAGKFPSEHDPVWSSLDWNKIAISHYNLNEDIYKQLKITLRADLSDDSIISYYDFSDGLSSGWYKESGLSTVTFSSYEMRISSSPSATVAHPTNNVSINDSWEFRCRTKVCGGGTSAITNIMYPFYKDSLNYIRIHIYIAGSAGSSTIRVDSYYLGVLTNLFYYNTSYLSASAIYKFRLRRVQYRMYFKFWESTITEPTSWNYISDFIDLNVINEGVLKVYAATGFGNYALFDDIYLDVDFKYTSPGVDGIYIGRSVEVVNIPPGNYKNIYLKTDIPQHDSNYLGSHSSNLRAWWDIPV